LAAGKIEEEFLKGLAKKVLKGENREEMDLSIVFVGKDRISELNKKYRGKNKTTDVLSFGGGLNEIVICPAVVKKKKELTRVLIHGILHLLGYDHEKSREDAKEMEKKQEYYLLRAQLRLFKN